MSSSTVVVALMAAAALALTLLPLISAAAPGPVIGRPGCDTTCGNVTVPFPFGFGPARCSAAGFNLICDNTTRPGRPRLLLGAFEVTEISIEEHKVHVTAPPVFSRARNLLQYMLWDSSRDGIGRGTELVVIGCNVEATLRTKVEYDNRYVVGCSSYCRGDRALTADDVRNNNTGICRTTIDSGQTYFDVELKRIHGVGGGTVNDDLPVSVLIAGVDSSGQELGERAVSLMNLEKPQGSRPKEEEDLGRVPVILDWECINDRSCNASASAHSDCETEGGDSVLFCQCIQGYEGNPYVTGGCQDIDECKHPKDNSCFGECGNKNGSFDCWCPRGYHGNASRPDGCIPIIKNTGLIIGLSVSVVPCFILLALAGMLIIHKLKHHKAERMKQKFFNQNRGKLLQQLVSNRSDIGERMIIPLKELEKATNNFDQTRKLGGGGHGTVYKGILSDLHVVAIKKSNIVVRREIDEFINEVAILSQINHRNVFKLYGCCLETEVPLLAYEFVCNGTLGEHLHHGLPRSLPWRDRLRIASEVGKAIAYLHSAVSVPVIHRDIKSSNILLDDALTAKVSDFGASRYIPIDQIGITATAVQGTIGYLDPMYYYTGRLSEMSDVYSFGVLLVELLTRKEPIKYRSSEGDGLVMKFVKLLEEGNLVGILDSQVVEEGGSEVEQVASLAASCLKLKGEQRPTMRHVEMALEGLQATNARFLKDLGDETNEENCIATSYPSTIRTKSLEELSRHYNHEEEFSLFAQQPR